MWSKEVQLFFVTALNFNVIIQNLMILIFNTPYYIEQ